MRCSFCGNKLSRKARFCPACGEAVAEVPAEESASTKKSLFKNKFSKKQLLKLGGIATAVLAAVILVVWLVTRPPKISAPDPEQFFGVSATKDDYYGTLKYTFPVPDGEEYLYLDTVEAYADLLNSNEHPYVLKEQEVTQGDERTNYTYELHYTGPDAVSQYFWTIKINYQIWSENSYMDSSVIISFSSDYRFEFEDVEEYEGRSFPLTIQGPMRYLGQEGNVASAELLDEHNSGSARYNYVLSLPFEETKKLLQNYIDTYLLGELRLQADGVDTSDEGEFRTFFACPGAEPYTTNSGEKAGTSSVFVGCWKNDDASTRVTFVGSPSFVVDEMAPKEKEAAPEPATASKPASQAEPEPEEKSSVWEDCPSCFGGQCSACGGRGGKDQYSPGLPREWEECWKCHGDGDCTKCDGFGKVLA